MSHKIYLSTKQHVILANDVAKATGIRAPYDRIAQELIESGILPLSMAPLPKPGRKQSPINRISDEDFESFRILFAAEMEGFSGQELAS